MRYRLRKTLHKVRNVGVGVNNVVEFLREVIANLLDKRENVVADLIAAVLLLAQNGQRSENNGFKELQKHFVALSVDQVEGLEHVVVLYVVLAQWKIRYKHRKHVLEWHQCAVDEDQSSQCSTNVVQNARVALLGDKSRECFEDLRIGSTKNKSQKTAKCIRQRELT